MPSPDAPATIVTVHPLIWRRLGQALLHLHGLCQSSIVAMCSSLRAVNAGAVGFAKQKKSPLALEKLLLEGPGSEFCFSGSGLSLILEWSGLDWIGYDWAGLDLDWIGLDRIGFGWIRSSWVGLEFVNQETIFQVQPICFHMYFRLPWTATSSAAVSAVVAIFDQQKVATDNINHCNCGKEFCMRNPASVHVGIHTKHKHRKLYLIIYHQTSSYIIKYNYISSNDIIYHQISTYIITYHHIFTNIIIYHQILSYIITYHYISTNIMIYH